jgi:hypothetical protein
VDWIQHLLHENPLNVVYANYIHILNNKIKSEAEVASIKRLCPILKQNFGNRFYYCGVAIKIDILNVFGKFDLKQPMTFIHSLIYSTNENVDEIAIGYVMNDDAVSYIKDLESIWNAYNATIDPSYKKPPLAFPLIKYKKEYIYRNLISELKNNVT